MLQQWQKWKETVLSVVKFLVFRVSVQDVSKINEGKQPLYQDDTNKRIINSLELLSGLDQDAIDAKRLEHPQAEMIQQEWAALCNIAVQWDAINKELIFFCNNVHGFRRLMANEWIMKAVLIIQLTPF